MAKIDYKTSYPMSHFDDDFDDFDEFDDSYENGKEHRELPVFKKAQEVLQIVLTLADIIDPQKDEIKITEQMLSNAMIIPAKIAGAEGGDIYSIRFDNAILIKLSARELLAQTNMLTMQELCDEKYVLLLRNTLEEFRIIFLEWVKSFDKENNLEDEWDIKNL